ncbi:Uncharacterised protein [Escherichia coli]|uniref:Uncharacterized protein n=1 Tax=Escherichia coli TaxID=562 RepID=A0A377A3V8_ECOLX|nr:Uncharacterised protein [Escherichia coli]
MQLVARPAPIVLMKVWDGDRQFVLCASSFQSSFCSFNNQFTLHFSQGTHDMKKETAIGVLVSILSVRLRKFTPR